MNMEVHLSRCCSIIFLLALTACSSDGNNPDPSNMPGNAYFVSGTITGLPIGTVIDLINTIDANKSTEKINTISVVITETTTTFRFDTSMFSTQTYQISEVSPTGYNCNQKINGSGEITTTDIKEIVINCQSSTLPVFGISGQVAGLDINTSGLSWSINGINSTLPTITDNGAINFGTKANGTYKISPINPLLPFQECTIQRGNGPPSKSVTVIVSDADVSDLTVNCAAIQYSVSVNVNWSDKPASFELLLVSNKDDINLPLVIGDNTSVPVTLSSYLFDGSDYSISISTQPADQTCTIGTSKSISGIINGNSVTETVTCAKNVGVAGVVNQLHDGVVMNLILSNSAGSPIDNISVTGKNTGMSPFQFANIPLYSTYNLAFAVQDHDCNFSSATGAGTVSQDGQSLQFDVATEYFPNVALDCTINKIPLDGLFSDINLQKCVAFSGRHFSYEVTSLDCSTTTSDVSRKIVDLSGIEQLSNLTTLNLSGHAVSQITPLTGLTQLIDLNLSNNKVNLTTVVDFADINAIPSLTNLDISNSRGLLNNNVTIFGFALGNLTALNLDFNSISALPIDAFNNVSNIQKLSIQGNGLTNIANNILMPPRLVQFNLSENKIVDVTALSTLGSSPNLSELNLAKNLIIDVAPLSSLTQLIALDLSNNDIQEVVGQKNVDSLETLINAENIDLTGNYHSNQNNGMLCTELETLINTHNNYIAVPNKIVVKPEPALSGYNCRGATAPTAHTISGTITNNSTTGHSVAGLRLELFLNGTSAQFLDISTISPFKFSVTLPIPNDSVYSIVVTEQPTDELLCTATTNAGPTFLTGSITNVLVSCVADPLLMDIANFNSIKTGTNDVFNHCIKPQADLTMLASEFLGFTATGQLTCDRNTMMISNLYGLQFLDQITSLVLRNQLIANFDIIVTSMTQLESLFLANNQISALPSNISTMKLGILELSFNQIIDIKPLANMNFEWIGRTVNTVLDLKNNAIMSVLPLSTLTNINNIQLQSQRDSNGQPTLGTAGIGDISSLSKLADGNNMTDTNTLVLADNPLISCSEQDTVYNTFLNAAFQPVPPLPIVVRSGICAP